MHMYSSPVTDEKSYIHEKKKRNTITTNNSNNKKMTSEYWH